MRAASRRCPGAQVERPFAFEHDGVLLHGRLDVLHREGDRALVLDYKTNALEDASPEEIIEGSYSLQRLVYALACFRAGAEEVEVVYHFLERPDAVVSRTFERSELPALEADLSEAIARINAGDFRPTPGEVCNGCPALDLVCARPAAAERRATDSRSRLEWRVATSTRRAGASGRSASGSSRSSSGWRRSTRTRRSR